MELRVRLAMCALVVLGTLCIAGCAGLDKGNNSTATATTAAATTTTPASNSMDYYADDLPEKLSAVVGEPLQLLHTASSRKDIVAWIDQTQFRHADLQSLGYNYLLVRFICTSGPQDWLVMLYVHNPESKSDPHPWKLCRVRGRNYTKEVNEIAFAALDPAGETLSLRREDGSTITSFPVKRQDANLKQ